MRSRKPFHHVGRRLADDPNSFLAGSRSVPGAPAQGPGWEGGIGFSGGRENSMTTLAAIVLAVLVSVWLLETVIVLATLRGVAPQEETSSADPAA